MNKQFNALIAMTASQLPPRRGPQYSLDHRTIKRDNMNKLKCFIACTIACLAFASVGSAATPVFPLPGINLGNTTYTTAANDDITSVSGALTALSDVKAAISQLASDRANIGSNEESLSYYGAQLSSLKNNLSAANSQITDVDVAQESTNYAKQNILVQTGTAMLAQANSLPQSVLKLLG